MVPSSISDKLDSLGGIEFRSPPSSDGAGSGWGRRRGRVHHDQECPGPVRRSLPGGAAAAALATSIAVHGIALAVVVALTRDAGPIPQSVATAVPIVFAAPEVPGAASGAFPTDEESGLRMTSSLPAAEAGAEPPAAAPAEIGPAAIKAVPDLPTATDEPAQEAPRPPSTTAVGLALETAPSRPPSEPQRARSAILARVLPPPKPDRATDVPVAHAEERAIPSPIPSARVAGRAEDGLHVPTPAREMTEDVPEPGPPAVGTEGIKAAATTALAPPPTRADGGASATTTPAFRLGAPANPLPHYPWLARRQGIEGRVVLTVKVGVDGRPQSVEVTTASGSPLLDRAARDAVLEWYFEPARRAGVPVPGTAEVPISFRLVD